ncbi:hypothetical protein PVK06_018071 [Gossypium arboreum]|uniref:Uncharacterized protein n=1 Tax=Gossypium arboreum TaxID=29729 RepID=A0ABR0Q560_GOSAR|nr:hypothetical protein PVK06_018071 [Gossypium arboreum]
MSFGPRLPYCGIQNAQFNSWILKTTSWVIGQTVGPVVKLGVHTDCARRGRGWRRSPLALRWCWIDEKGEAESQGEERNGCSDGAFGGSRFAMLRDLRGENFGDVDGKIDGEMEERNQGQNKGVGDNGVLGLEMTKRRSMDTKAKKWAKGKGVMAGAHLQGRPSDEMIGNHLHDSVELKSVMKGLVCELERTPEKTLMEGDSHIVKECMVVEDALNEQ